MIGVELFVLLLAIVAAWLSVRPPPSLEWERLWKVTLATVIRGDVEANGGNGDDWWDRLAAVPFHPAGRDAVAKLCRPSLDDVAVPALEGERALMERLTQSATIAERWETMFRDDPLAMESLTSDPAQLGPAYDPSVPLAPNLNWEDIACWTSDVQSAVARRMGSVVIAGVGIDTRPLIAAIPHGRVVDVTESDDMAAQLLESCTAAQDRLMLLAKGSQVLPLLQALHGSPALRDRVLVVVSLGGTFDADADWLNDHFQHLEFDTELNRRTVYFAVSNVDRQTMNLVDQALPVPTVPPSGWAPIESIDLGLLPIDEHDPELFARALWVLLCFCLSSR